MTVDEPTDRNRTCVLGRPAPVAVGDHEPMSVQIVTAQPGDWAAYRELRLRSLRESPDAYGSTYAFEADFSPELWQQRLTGATTFLAVLDDDRKTPIGTVTGLQTA